MGKERTYFCIDMKTFYASVECSERGLNPFETNLVVADASRGNGALCLAISPRIMLMYGKEASNRKQEIDRQHYTIPNQRPKDKHCGKI